MKWLLKSFGIFLALIAVGVISAFAVVALLLRQEEVRVPDLVGQDIVAAIDPVAQQGLQLKVERREPHPTLAKDIVVAQTPAAGSMLKKGRPVRVVISLGPNEMLTPKLVGEQYRKAEIMIRQAGFLPAVQSKVYSESVERDIVLAQAPSVGLSLEKGSPISLLISAGKKPSVLVMPRLIGKKAEDAVRVVDRMGLQHRVVFRAAGDGSTSAGRMVLSQKPFAGYPVVADMSVDIVVSK